MERNVWNYEVSNGHTKGKYQYKQKSWFFAWKIKLVNSYVDWLKIKTEEVTLQHIKHTIFKRDIEKKTLNSLHETKIPQRQKLANWLKKLNKLNL